MSNVSTAKRLCSVDGCERPIDARGWCSTHYGRWRTYGNPLAVPAKPANGSTLAWLRDTIAYKEPDDECWECPFLGSGGYGRVNYKGRDVRAAGIALVLSGCPQPPKGYALHSCDNPPCVNPAHLRWGTQTDNMRDAKQRGRIARGERHYSAKLTEASVKAILLDSRPQHEIADAYGVSRSLISRIKSRSYWTHVSGGAVSPTL